LSECSIFDVSHMLQTKLTGKNAMDAIESICTADVQGLNPDSGCLSLFTNEQGGIYGRFMKYMN
jgi:aminomethyltransferase